MPKGYYTSAGFMGWLPSLNQYRLFATEDEYIEWFEEYEKDL